VFVRIAYRNDVELGARQEGVNAHVDNEAALDDILDGTFDEAAFGAFVDYVVPCALLFGAALADDDHAVLVLELFEEYFDFLTDRIFIEIPEFLDPSWTLRIFPVTMDPSVKFLRVSSYIASMAALSTPMSVLVVDSILKREHTLPDLLF